MKNGIIILGHGSKAPQALETLQAVGTKVQQTMTGFKVEVASMEFNKPDIPEAVANLVNQGVNKIVVVPFFLYFGIHLQEDIPEILKEEKAKYPGVEIVMASNLGADTRLVDIL
ncbi:MAG: CbiX/SirB N-terminal domain-containing protein, partial [Clostridia bacterium]|nr:CbiX/SirB N-terminal domain-containing protein [Clostridia bacterium]